jgi:hypothetical protein
MSECRAFSKYQAIYQPRCNCTACWNKYFDTHLMQVEVAKQGFSMFGTKAVTNVRGEVYVKQVQRYIKESNGVSSN